MFSFGQGDHGELGYGEQVSSQPEPRLLSTLVLVAVFFALLTLSMKNTCRRLNTLGYLTPVIMSAGWKHSLIIGRSMSIQLY
jgi:hypothetical protein